MKTEESNKLVIFEKITPSLYPILWSYINRRYEVYVFDFTWDLKNRKYLRDLINADKLKRIFITPNNPANGRAIDLAETIYAAMGKSGILKIMRSLYQSDEIGLLVKKELARNLFKYLFITNYFNDLKQTKSKRIRIIFIPDQFWVCKDIVRRFGNAETESIGDVEVFRKTAIGHLTETGKSSKRPTRPAQR